MTQVIAKILESGDYAIYFDETQLIKGSKYNIAVTLVHSDAQENGQILPKKGLLHRLQELAFDEVLEVAIDPHKFAAFTGIAIIEMAVREVHRMKYYLGHGQMVFAYNN